ncbi:MAG: hypothetical protein K1X66_08305 [Verrucomicrobiae bacterium]|nr:hypothetical protein [Verrucomicrobiae bacterium]
MKKITQFLCVASLVGFAHLGQSQISITGSLPQNYTQDFDSLGTNTVPWANESTIAGWSYVRSTNGLDAGVVSQLVESDGTFPFLFTPAALNLGTTADADRALGSRPGFFILDQITNEFFYGARFVNNSLGTITNVNVSYNGEQWRDNNATPHVINFFYRLGGSDFLGDTNNIGWTAFPALDFTSPNNAGMNVTVDGNAPGNRTALNANISLNIAPGETFWIRWADLFDAGVGDHLAIDDVNITFNGINPAPVLGGVSIELKKPKVGKKLKFKSSKGFKLKAFVFSESNAVTKASYAAFGGTNSPTNLTFINAGKFKILTKGKLFKKKGVKAIIQSTKTTKPGVGVTESPVTLLVRVFGGSNDASEVTFTNTFSDVKIK